MYKVFILKTLNFFLVKFLHAFPQEDRLNEMNLAEFPCTCNATHKKCQIYVNENIPTFLDFYNEVSMYTT